MDNKLLLVSLVHNRKEFLSSCIESVLSQSLDTQYWSYLLWDNNSTDGAREIAKEYSDRHDNIFFYGARYNMMQQPAYNKILYDLVPENFNDCAIMAILDADDLLYTNALSEIKQSYDRHPEVGGCYSDFSVCDEQGNIIKYAHEQSKLAPDQYTPEGQKILRNMQLESNVGRHMRSYSILALKTIGGFNEEKEYATDCSIFCGLMDQFPVYKICKILYKWRKHYMTQVGNEHRDQQTKDQEYIREKYRQKWKETGRI